MQVGRRGRLAGEALAGGDLSVDDELEAVGQAGGRENCRCVARGRHDGDGGAARGEVVEQRHRRRVGRHTLLIEDGGEGGVLAVAEAADGLGLGAVVGRALGQVDAPRGDEVTHPVEAWLAIDVGEVVCGRVGLDGLDTGPLSQEVVEHPVPGAHVHLDRRRQHPVEVEESGVVVIPVHGLEPRVPIAGARWGRPRRADETAYLRSDRDAAGVDDVAVAHVTGDDLVVGRVHLVG